MILVLSGTSDVVMTSGTIILTVVPAVTYSCLFFCHVRRRVSPSSRWLNMFV